MSIVSEVMPHLTTSKVPNVQTWMKKKKKKNFSEFRGNNRIF